MKRQRRGLWFRGVVLTVVLCLAVYGYGGTFPEGSPARDVTSYLTIGLFGAGLLLGYLFLRAGSGH